MPNGGPKRRFVGGITKGGIDYGSSVNELFIRGWSSFRTSN